MNEQPFYILVPNSRKRKASDSPSLSVSSRAPSPNPSPTKKIRGKDVAVEVTTSRLSRFALETPRRESPTVSDLGGPTLCSGDDGHSLSPDDDRTTARKDNVFEFDKETEYVGETALPDLLHERDGDGLPIRRIRDFRLFNRDNLQFITPTQLLDTDLSKGMYSASGIVGAVDVDEVDSDDSDEDYTDEDDESPRVKSLVITGFDVHDFDEGEVNKKIFIQTKRAWYILDRASPIYEPFWKPFWIQHRFAHLVITASLDEPRMTAAQFIDYLNSSNADEALTEAAFQSDEVVTYITEAIERVIEAGAPIVRVPLIRRFIDPPLLLLPHKSPPGPRVPKAQPKGAKKADTVPLVTPIIKRVLDKHLTSPMSVVGAEYEEANTAIANELRDVIEHHVDPQSMRWRKVPDETEYSGVEMDGVVYKIGDVVAVAPGNDSNADRADSELSAISHCINKFANNVWFIRIMSFYDHPTEKQDGKPRKMLHGQWFTHGSRIILQETPHSQELFLLNECDGIAVASIFQRCDVRFLDVHEAEEPDNADPEARNFFYRYLYDNEEHSFLDPPSEVGNEYPLKCPSCKRAADMKLYNSVQIVDDGVAGVALHGRVYHVDDYVYVKSSSVKKGLVLFIARIIKINCGTTDIALASDVTLRPGQLRVRHYERDLKDPRKICWTRHTNCVDAEDLDGLCFAQPFDLDQHADEDEMAAWVDSHPDHFYTDAEDDFKRCEACFEQHVEELKQAEGLALRFDKIPVLEVFSGAGGLSQGLDQSGFFKTSWAVERSVPAAKTFELNHPESKVLCADINDLLRYSVDLRDGKTPTPLLSSHNPPIPIPDSWIPRPGEPGLVCGGPPCQSFSGANSHKKEDDPRSTLPFTMLSVAEVYEPNYFLLENVTGLLQHSVTSKAGDGGLVKKATLKLIIRCLLALNYTVRFKVLQAGQYGAPQDRERLIFFGAKRGCKLPEFPIPTHAFMKPAKKYQLFIQNDFIPPAKRGRGPDDNHIFAPHASVTIKDAIGDLPAFDWINPLESAALGGTALA